jgi:hypothetical protein
VHRTHRRGKLNSFGTAFLQFRKCKWGWPHIL